MNRQSWFLAIVIILITAPGLSAAKHPVPLEKNVTDAKCLECHEDKTKGKVVHAAVQTGCLSCHFVRVNNPEDTRITLKNTRPGALCLSCHENMTVKPSSAFHAPSATDCTKCHDPHVSANEKLLKKTATGGKDENLCLSCHKQGLDVPKGGSRHAALDMGCGTCHATHKSGDPTKQEFKFHLLKTSPALCIDCHDPKDAALGKAHNGQPFANSNCVQCHDPHQSKSPKLMQASVHQPFEDKTGCATCHEAPVNGKVKLTQADTKALCVTCHDEVGKKIDTAKVQHPGAQGDCTACHDPHAGRSPRMMKPDPVNACLACHEDQAKAIGTKSVLHAAAYKQGCTTCHESHGSNNQHLVRANGNALCTSCHTAKPSNAQTGGEGKPDTLFGGAVELPPGFLATTHKVMTTDHPVTGHPVAGANKFGKGDMGCVSCHTPHAGGKNLFVKDITNTKALCTTCHTS